MGLPSLTTRVAFASDPLASSPTWTTLNASRPLAFTIERGRDTELDDFQAGTYTLTLDNRDRLFDPANTSSTYTGQQLPRKRVSQQATWSGTTYDLFGGFVNRWPQSWDGIWQQTQVPATDAFGILQNEAVTGLRTDEQSDVRVGWLLDEVGWPAGQRTLAAGQVSVQGADFVAANALDQMRATANAELGFLFCGGDGSFVFQDKYYRINNYASSAVTFSDSPTGGELPFTSFAPDLDVDHIYNHVVYRQANVDAPTTYEYQDSTSRTAYGPSAKTDDLWVAHETEAEARAQYFITRYAQPVERILTLTINPQMNDSLWPWALGLDFGQMVTVKSRYFGRGSTLTLDCRIEGIRHDYTAQPLTWTTTFRLSPVSTVETQTYWLLGTSTLGTDTRLIF